MSDIHIILNFLYEKYGKNNVIWDKKSGFICVKSYSNKTLMTIQWFGD